MGDLAAELLRDGPALDALGALTEAYLATRTAEEALVFMRALRLVLERRRTNVVDFRAGRVGATDREQSASWLEAKLHVWLLTFGEPMVTPQPSRRAPRPRARAPRLGLAKPR